MQAQNIQNVTGPVEVIINEMQSERGTTGEGGRLTGTEQTRRKTGGQ